MCPLDSPAMLAGPQDSKDSTRLGKLLHFRVVILKEAQVLIRHIHVGITAQSLMFFLSRPTSTKRMRFDLLGNLLRIVSHEDGRVFVRGRHLGIGTLKGGEEFRVEEGGLFVAQSVRGISREQELKVSFCNLIKLEARPTYGSWSMAQGIRQGMSSRVPKIWGKELEKEGVA